MALSNAEKGRQYGKKMGEYVNKQYGVVGEIRYHMKYKRWAVTVGDVAVTGDTQDEVETAIGKKLLELSQVKWYKIIIAEFKTLDKYHRDGHSGVQLSISRRAATKMPDGDWRSISLKTPGFRFKDEDKGTYITEDEMFDSSFEITHEFAMSQNYSHLYMGAGRDLDPESFPVSYVPQRTRDMTTYMYYTEDMWEKLNTLISILDTTRDRIAELLTVDEEMGYPLLLDMAIHSNNLLSGGEDE